MEETLLDSRTYLNCFTHITSLIIGITLLVLSYWWQNSQWDYFSVWMYMCMYDLCTLSFLLCIFLNYLFFKFLMTCFYLNFDLGGSARLVGQSVPRILLYVPVYCWGYKCTLLDLLSIQILEFKLRSSYLQGKYFTKCIISTYSKISVLLKITQIKMTELFKQ